MSHEIKVVGGYLLTMVTPVMEYAPILEDTLVGRVTFAIGFAILLSLLPRGEQPRKVKELRGTSSQVLPQHSLEADEIVIGSSGLISVRRER